LQPTMLMSVVGTGVAPVEVGKSMVEAADQRGALASRRHRKVAAREGGEIMVRVERFSLYRRVVSRALRVSNLTGHFVRGQLSCHTHVGSSCRKKVPRHLHTLRWTVPALALGFTCAVLGTYLLGLCHYWLIMLETNGHLISLVQEK
jgi:hypothetical protein